LCSLACQLFLDGVISAALIFMVQELRQTATLRIKQVACFGHISEVAMTCGANNGCQLWGDITDFRLIVSI
jgi:hypothetical protein